MNKKELLMKHYGVCDGFTAEDLLLKNIKTNCASHMRGVAAEYYGKQDLLKFFHEVSKAADNDKCKRFDFEARYNTTIIRVETKLMKRNGLTDVSFRDKQPAKFNDEILKTHLRKKESFDILQICLANKDGHNWEDFVYVEAKNLPLLIIDGRNKRTYKNLSQAFRDYLQQNYYKWAIDHTKCKPMTRDELIQKLRLCA